MKLLLVLLFFSGINTSAQSVASATASATIVTPMGTEKLSDINYSSATNTEAVVILGLDKFEQNKKISNHQINGSALFKISSEAFSFALIVNADPINIKRVTGNESVLAESFITRFDKSNNETIVSVGATLYIENGQMPGLYSDKSQLNILVNFE